MSTIATNKIKKLPYLKSAEFFTKNEEGYVRQFFGVGDTTGIDIDLPSEKAENFVEETLPIGTSISNNMNRLIDKANKNCEVITIYQEIENDVSESNIDGFYIRKIGYTTCIRTDFKIIPTVKGVEKECIVQGLQQKQMTERVKKAELLNGVK